MSVNELSVAQAVAEGVLPSPTVWQNSEFVCLRLSGTGVAWRESCGEYVYRSPIVWCASSILRRFLSVPVVISHPDTGPLTSRSFGNTVVGIVVHTYVNEEEQAPWGVARILDKTAARMIEAGLFCTSPGVVIDTENCATTEIDGRKLLVEGAPLLIDHLALVDMSDGNKGVWQRDDAPGVQVDAAKTDAAEDCLVIRDMKVIYV